MDAEESRVSVWVGQEEKLVSGLTRRTTCANVVKALLEEQEGQGQSHQGSQRSYSLVEKWRGGARTLPPGTRILRLWRAWGAERANVRLLLTHNHRNHASLPAHSDGGPRSKEARVVPSKRGPCALPYAPQTEAWQEKERRRIVRKAFRKLQRINRRREQQEKQQQQEEEEEEEKQEAPSSLERMETLVHLVLSQDSTLRLQLQRLRELDRHIDRYEATVHLDRVRQHGVNYVQDTYLLEDADLGHPQHFQYVQRRRDLCVLQERLQEQEALADRVAEQIQQELDNERDLEEERMRTQLEASLYVGLRLSTELQDLHGELNRSRERWEDRDRELRDLLEQTRVLDLQEEEEERDWVEEEEEEEETGIAKAQDANDEDSDTGLSSMHSQDSDNAPVCESLV